MSVQYGGDKITFSDGSTVGSGWTGMKNRLINGGMVFDQRNAGSSVTINGDVYTLDRWKAFQTQAGKFSVQQNAGSVTPPAGFTNYLGVTSLSSYSVTSGDYFLLNQPIEGYNVADLDFGKATAKTITVSFWVRSSLTGTFGAAYLNDSFNRTYPFTYTISAANTWEQKTITIVGDTTGTWTTGNGNGGQLRFVLGCGSARLAPTPNAWNAGGYDGPTGSTSVVGTNGATFYITGVQLEKGSTATSFDYRPYTTELQLCQRYYFKNAPNTADGSSLGIGIQTGTTNAAVHMNFPVEMRSTPTIAQSNTIISDNTNFDANVTNLSTAYLTKTGGYANFEFASAGSTNRPVLLRVKNSGAIGFVAFSAEL